MLHGGSSCSLARAMDRRIMCCGIISSCQSAATFDIVKRYTEHVFIVEQRYTSSTQPLPLPLPLPLSVCNHIVRLKMSSERWQQ